MEVNAERCEGCRRRKAHESGRNALGANTTGIYNIGSGEPVTLNQIVSVIDSYTYSITKKHVSIRYADQKDLKKGYVMSLEKSKKHLCYQPQYKGVEVVQQVLYDYHANQ